MTTRYVGLGGNDANSGLSYALRKLTLNGVEDTPVVAGDIIYVAPGVYRELLTVDVSGTNGNPIVYIGDVTGEHTDGIGGVVRITGSNDDLVATRANCVTATSKDYRTFRGFSFDTTTAILVTLITACGNWIIEDCYVYGVTANVASVSFGGTGTTNTMRRCVLVGGRAGCVAFTHSSAVDNSGHLIENCLMLISPASQGIIITRVGGISSKNCTFLNGGSAIRTITAALTVGQTTTVNNCIIGNCQAGLQALTAPGTNEEITENYNAFYGNVSDRSNVSTGANSNTYPPLFAPPIMLSGIAYLKSLFALSPWSPLRAIAGANMSTDDLVGITRPTVDAKKSWGAIQFHDLGRDTTTKRTGAASLRLADAGRHQVFVPVSNVATTFSCYVYWEADYAGTKPSMLIRQPGQSTTTVTAVGSAGSWELLTVTLTPAASPGYVVVDFRSTNTAVAGNYKVYFDDLVVT
jgi:hypothetical protein